MRHLAEMLVLLVGGVGIGMFVAWVKELAGTDEPRDPMVYHAFGVALMALIRATDREGNKQ